MGIILTGDELKHGPNAREWLETNGLGGYASSTLQMCHQRKYHGLLVANLPGPPGRHVLLSKFEDSIHCGRDRLFLSAHQYPGCFFPQGGLALKEFRQGLYPIFYHERDGFELLVSILSLYGRDGTLIRYRILKLPAPEGTLSLRPFLACRGYHRLARANPGEPWPVEETAKGYCITLPSVYPRLHLTFNKPSRFLPAPGWYYDFEYLEEKKRGYDWREDLYQPGTLELAVAPGSEVFVLASLRPAEEEPARLWQEEERRRLNEQSEKLPGRSGLDSQDQINLKILGRAARQFLIRTPAGRSAVLAGYHWFTDWGRDTLISLPGLTFCHGHLDEGLDILTQLAGQEKEGLLPNYFSEDSEDNPYNTVDSSLWFFWACQQYLFWGGRREALRAQVWPTMKRILQSFRSQTRFDIYATPEGLLHAGNRETHLTWMDACIGGRPVTPRFGFPVEINALWYNALGFAIELAEGFGEESFAYRDLFQRATITFPKTFWLEEKGYLADVFNEGRPDPALRPNQLLAVSLPHSPLDLRQARSVLAEVQKHLLTPCGLRTLAPHDPAYRGSYEGDQAARDAAYHQGTVWPWLFGPFGEASLRVSANPRETRVFLWELLRRFLRGHLSDAGVGTVSEIFSGDAPHLPQGCISQAWSIAEILRLYCLLKLPL